MSDTNSTNPGSAGAIAAAGTSLPGLEAYFSSIQSLLEESFRDLGIRTTWQDDASTRAGVRYEPLNAEGTSEAASLISRIEERVPGELVVGSGDEGNFLFQMGLFARSHPAPVIREAATRVSALVFGLECLNVSLKMDDDQLEFTTSRSARGEEWEQSQRLIAKIMGLDPPSTSDPSKAPTAE
jgi:hypothetical protein